MYGLDLREALWGTEPIGVRRLVSLVSSLPITSATAQALDPNEGWSQEDELLASIVDMIGVNTQVLIQANGGKGKEPMRFPRPSDFNKRRAQSSEDEMRAFFLSSDMNWTDNMEAHYNNPLAPPTENEGQEN